MLYHKKILSQPMFYIIAYLERNRDVYYERLLAISRDGDWNGWISFFLEALVLQSEENSKKARAILELYNGMKTRVARSHALNIPSRQLMSCSPARSLIPATSQ
jgi:Fic family protein